MSRAAWTPTKVRRFSAGCAETDLVVVGTSVLMREDVTTAIVCGPELSPEDDRELGRWIKDELRREQ